MVENNSKSFIKKTDLSFFLNVSSKLSDLTYSGTAFHKLEMRTFKYESRNEEVLAKLFFKRRADEPWREHPLQNSTKSSRFKLIKPAKLEMHTKYKSRNKEVLAKLFFKRRADQPWQEHQLQNSTKSSRFKLIKPALHLKKRQYVSILASN